VPYVIDNTSGDTTFYVQDGTVDRNSAVALVGRNTPDYGEVMNENFVSLLENHANTLPPNVTEYLNGQLWFDTSQDNDLLKVWSKAGNWTPVTRLKISQTQPSPLESTDGNLFYDSTIQKSQIKISGDWVNADYAGYIKQQYGTRLRSLILADSAGIDRAVLAVTYVNDTATHGNPSTNEGTTTSYYGKETLLLIISEHDEFTVANMSSDSHGESINWYPELSSVGGIGTIIRKGTNVRCDSTTSPVPGYVSRSQRAQKAFTLNTGTYDTHNCLAIDSTDSINIDAANVAHNLADFIPQVNSNISLGNVSNQFKDVYTGNLYFNGNITALDNTTNIGTISVPVLNAFFTEIGVNGNINILDSNVDIGSLSLPAKNIYSTELFASTSLTIGDALNGGPTYKFPSTYDVNSFMVTDIAGDLTWYNLKDVVSDITAINGIKVESVTAGGIPGPGDLSTTSFSVGVSIEPGQGLRFINGNLAINAADLTTDLISEGSQNKYFTSARARAAISSAAPLKYNSTNGIMGVIGDTLVGSVKENTLGAIEVIQSTDSNNITQAVLSVRAGKGLYVEDVTGTLRVGTDLFSGSSPVIRGAENEYGIIGIQKANAGRPAYPYGSIFLQQVKNSDKLGNQDPTYYLNTSSAAQTKSGSLTIAGITHDFNGFKSINTITVISPETKIQGKLTATGDICSVSDINTKSNINDIPDCLNKVMRMRPVSYEQYDQDKIGFIAQQMKHVVPEVVSEDNDGLMAIAYPNLVAVMAGAIQELQTQIQDLKKQLGN
jgi:hypothetical protein